MAMPALANRHWTAAEVRKLIEESPEGAPRYELVDGELLVTPSPARPHQYTVLELATALHAYLKVQRVARVLVSPSDVELEPEFISQPDVYVVALDEARRLRDNNWPVHNLLLAIEVLSPSSARHDRVRKRPKYQKHVPEYWIVDPDARVVERWRPADDRPEIVTETLRWQPPGAGVPLDIDLVALFRDALDDPGAASPAESAPRA